MSGNNSLRLDWTLGRVVMLSALVVATILLIPLHNHFLGGLVWMIAMGAALLDPVPAVKRRIGVLLGCLVILAICDINTSTKNENFLQVGIPFALVIILPALIFRFTDRGIIQYRLRPDDRPHNDILYTILSIPLSWLVLKIYWAMNPDLHLQWEMPPQWDQSEIKRLFIGINLVGVWDELFFICTVFATLRSLFPYWASNIVQSVVYTSVLYDMAFVGAGPIIVGAFAWTQGAMFEKSRSLLFVLIVHLIVDYFLVAAIVGNYYPGAGLDYLWRHGL